MIFSVMRNEILNRTNRRKGYERECVAPEFSESPKIFSDEEI